MYVLNGFRKVQIYQGMHFHGPVPARSNAEAFGVDLMMWGQGKAKIIEPTCASCTVGSYASLS